ncbi:penicillin-binding protein 2 [Candidatus Parcubacteria bacterium]|nr:penicillin-binding protein 2 [Candidatus Parcubacteria bacterium]
MKLPSLSRIRGLSVLTLLFAALLIGKLFFLQVVRGSEYSEAADRQYTAPAASIFDRGSIFFKERGGELASAATLASGYILAMNPKELVDPQAAYQKLSSVITLSHDEFFEKAGKKDDPYEELAHRLSRESADKIDALSLPGIHLYREKWRFYPGGTAASRILGFVGYNNGNVLAGRYGLERYYEEVLGRSTDGLYVNFFAEVFSNLGDALLSRDTREGDVILTIEPEVERALGDELKSVMKEWNSDLAGGIVMNPKDGSIYAMEVLPGFDPNNLKTAGASTLGDPLVESVYEMGSIMKPLTMAAGLDAGVVSAKTTYDDKGFVELDGATIKNFDGKGRGVVSMQEVLNQSLNTGMAFVAKKLGRDNVRQYLLDYGLGEETGIDLPGEVAGLVKNLQSPRDLEYATAAFGQGIATTPIATVRALASLANGGYLVSPHVTGSIDYKGGFSREPEYTLGRQVLSKESSEEITRMLVDVVDNALLGGTVKIPEYSVAAKTGTAQMAREGGKGYYDDRYLHSFFGYFPAYDPKFLVFLYTVNPKNVNYASHTLTGPFIRLTKFLLNYYEVPPDR